MRERSVSRLVPIVQHANPVVLEDDGVQPGIRHNGIVSHVDMYPVTRQVAVLSGQVGHGSRVLAWDE